MCGSPVKRQTFRAQLFMNYVEVMRYSPPIGEPP